MIKKGLTAFLSAAIIIASLTLSTVSAVPLEVEASEDAFANFNNQTQNTGNATWLNNSSNPSNAKESFYKFTVPSQYINQPAPGTGLTFNYFVAESSAGDLADITCLDAASWNENTLNWNNRPAGAQCGSGTDSVTNGWNSVPLDFALDDTAFTIRIQPDRVSGNAQFTVNSSESSNEPYIALDELVVPTPTPTPTATPSPTPSPTPTPTPGDCVSVPGEPENVTSTVLDADSVLIDWDAPGDTGGCPLIDYRVINRLGMAFTEHFTVDTELQIDGLVPGDYTADVQAGNALGYGSENSTDYTIVADPTPTPTPTATPTPTPTPTASPPPAGDCDDIRGYGSSVTGGTNTVNVATFAALKTAAAQAGNRVVITGNGVLDGNGATVNMGNNTTLTRAAGSTAVLWDTWIKVQNVNNVLLEDFVIRTGDDSVSVDADAINIIAANGQTTSNVAVNKVEAIFGPDVTFTVLTNGGSTENVTLQCNLIGNGLYESIHPESGDGDGHGLALNISDIGGGGGPERVTVVDNLVFGSQGRNIRVTGADFVDVVNNVVYNFAEGPQGNPKGMNYVNNLLREGPAPEDVGLNEVSTPIWRVQVGGDDPGQFTNSLWETGNVCDMADGTPCARQNSNMYRTSTYGTLSVTPASTTGLLTRTLANAGPTTRDALTSQWISETTNRTGEYWSGKNKPAPVARPQ